jgi:DNA-binding protein H-NS
LLHRDAKRFRATGFPDEGERGNHICKQVWPNLFCLLLSKHNASVTIINSAFYPVHFQTGVGMEDNQFRDMSTDELYELHTLVSQILAERLTKEKTRLEERLRAVQPHHAQRHAQAMYRNPDNPSETWTGHGRRPRWITQQLSAGKRLEDLKARILAKKHVVSR